MTVDVLLGVFFFGAIVCVLTVPWMAGGEHGAD